MRESTRVRESPSVANNETKRFAIVNLPTAKRGGITPVNPPTANIVARQTTLTSRGGSPAKPTLSCGGSLATMVKCPVPRTGGAEESPQA